MTRIRKSVPCALSISVKANVSEHQGQLNAHETWNNVFTKAIYLGKLYVKYPPVETKLHYDATAYGMLRRKAILLFYSFFFFLRIISYFNQVENIRNNLNQDICF